MLELRFVFSKGDGYLKFFIFDSSHKNLGNRK